MPIEPRASTPREVSPLAVAALTTLVVTAASYLLPLDYKALGVAVVFLGATYWLVIREDNTQKIRQFGLSLGGLAEPEPLRWSRLLQDGCGAVVWAGLVALVVFPLFWRGFLFWNAPRGSFQMPPMGSFAEDLAGQLMVVALPEEGFYRGYLQTRLDRQWRPRWSLLGAQLGPGLVLTSAVFALGHLATDFHPARLAVFFPSLLFGWLRARTGGIGAGLVFHAACNLFASFLLRGYGLGS